MYNFFHKVFGQLSTRYAGLKTTFKTFFLLIIIFLIFFAVNLFFTVKNKPESAYTMLQSQSRKHKLQDTRVHNWSEIEKKHLKPEVRNTK